MEEAQKTHKKKLSEIEEQLDINLKESLDAERALIQEEEDTKDQIEQTTRLLAATQKNNKEATEDKADAEARLAELEK